MKWIKMRYLALTLLILLVTGCKNFVETESNIPPAPPDPAEVLEAVIYALAEQYGQGYDRYASIFVQHCTSPVGIARDLGCYQLRNEFFNTDFEQMYTPVFSYLRTLLETAIEKEKPHYAGVAQILTAAGLGKLTDTYGDIPWTEALQREIIAFPKYDTQEEIYHEIQRLLSDAIINLNAPTTSDLLPGDPIYKGDIRKWKAAAYALKARYYNHLSKRYPAQSAADVLAAIDQARALGFEEYWDMELIHDGLQSSNSWKEAVESENIVGANGFIQNLIENEDPRLAAYFQEVSPGVYKGRSVHCFDGEEEEYSGLNPNGYFTRSTSPTPFINYFELLFIEAEAAFRAGDLHRAATVHNLAVIASIRKVVDVSSEDVQLKVEQYCNRFAAEQASSITLGKIMHEKYKAMFTRGIETWVDLRRHNFRYPHYLNIPLNASHQPLGTDYIRRVLYPLSELQLNPENTPNAGIFERMWWDR